MLKPSSTPFKSPQSFQYPDNWNRVKKSAYRLQPLCTVNPFHGKASVVHHLKYKRSLLRRFLGLFLLHRPTKSVSGFEIPGYDVVTVCKHCHANDYGYGSHRRSLHYKTVWIKKGGINNYQVWYKALELRLKFWVLATVLRVWFWCFKRNK